MGVINQPHQFAQRRRATQIDDAVQGRVVAALLADLDEEYLSLKMIDYGLVATKVPPFDGEVVFSSGDDDPVRDISAHNFVDLRRERLLGLGEMDIPLEKCRSNSQAEMVVQVFNETMEKMKRLVVGLVDQRVMTLQHFDFGIGLLQWRQIRVVFPKFRTRGSNICTKSAGITSVQVPHGGGEHDDVARRLEIFENPLLHFGHRIP